GPEQHETHGRVRTHATRMCSRHSDEVLHEELVNAQVDTTQVLTAGQPHQEHHQHATESSQASPATQQREHATAGEQESEGSVILHRGKGRYYLEQVHIMRMPP